MKSNVDVTDMIDKKTRNSGGRDGRSSDTRQRIYEAALALFMKHGYNKVTIDDICNKIGLTKGAFYAHFESKGQIVMERVLAVDHHYRDVLLPQVAGLETAAEKLVVFFRLFLAYMDELGKETVRSAYHIQIGYDKKISSPIAERRELYRILEELVLEGQRNGEFRTDLTGAEIAQVLMHNIRGIVYNWCLPISKFSIEQFGESMLSILVAGLHKDRNRDVRD
jgi:TetR/AcrR family transcriptional regulator, cholesterol catabolism regulator